VDLAREAQLESEVGEAAARVLEPVKGMQQADPVAIAVEREAGVPAEEAREVKRGHAHRPGQLVEGQGLPEPPKQERLGFLDELDVAPARRSQPKGCAER
jgi:hypothetical protein